MPRNICVEDLSCNLKQCELNNPNNNDSLQPCQNTEVYDSKEKEVNKSENEVQQPSRLSPDSLRALETESL